jgi:hypothetical protein
VPASIGHHLHRLRVRDHRGLLSPSRPKSVLQNRAELARLGGRTARSQEKFVDRGPAASPASLRRRR